MKAIRYKYALAAVLVAAVAASAGYNYWPGRAAAPGADDGSVALPITGELAWDNGVWEYLVWADTGAASWVGNDFDLTGGAGGQTRVVAMRFYSSDQHPNAVWDGFRAALFAFTPGPPAKVGRRVWPPGEENRIPFIKPNPVHNEVWVAIPVDWVAPGRYIVAAVEQFYNDPNCDPFAVDTNATFRGHSWMTYSGLPWEPLQTAADPYRNLMLRLEVEDVFAVNKGWTKTSYGRVKALYK